MTTTTGGVVVDTFSHKLFPSKETNFLSPSENWDDDFEFQAHEDSRITENASESTHASGNKSQFEEGEESWDDAYADEDAPSFAPRRVPKADINDDEEIEDWDSSDNEAEHCEASAAHEFGAGSLEEEDKTVTARSTASSRFRSPPPPLPLLPPPPPVNIPFELPSQDAVLPLSVASPTLSTFSIPLSSNRDHSIYSHEGLIRNSSGSAPHLTIMRSYPHGAGSTPPRKGRRLRKKSRPPEVDIIELEDCTPMQPASTNNRPAAFPQSSPTDDDTPIHTSQLPSPPATSLLTRIGSFKRWTRRSIGPEDVSYTGWRRAKSSFGPSDITDLPKQDVNPLRSTSPPVPPVRNRNRGSSASGLKSGWFFRSGGAVDVETILAPPKQVSTTKSSSPAEPSAKVVLQLNEHIDPDSFALTPRKSKSRLVPILKSPIRKKPGPSMEQPLESSGITPSPESSFSNPSKYNGHYFPRYSVSVGRHAGSTLVTEVLEKNSNKDKEGGVKGLVKGVRRLSQVGNIAGHKRTKSTGKANDESKPFQPETEEQPISTTPTLLPPVELNSPILPTTMFSRRTSLPRADFAYVIPFSGDEQPTYTLSPSLHLEDGMSMERASFSSSRAPSRLDMMDKPPTGSPPRPKPSRRATSPLPSIPPSPPRQASRPESAMSTKRPSSATSTRRPGSSSSSCPPVSSQAQALAAQSFRPRTPVRNPPALAAMSGRPRTPNKFQPVIPSPQQSTAPSAYTASLGRTATPPQSSKPTLKRNSLNDLRSLPSKSTLINETRTPSAPSDGQSNGDTTEHKSLDQRRASTNTLGDLKIPARISKVQQGLRRDLGMLRDFAGYVEQLKRLQNSYMKLIGELCVAYESYPMQHVPSRPPSQIGFSRKGFTNNSNASTQSIQGGASQQQPTSMLLNSPTKAKATRNYSRSSGDLNRELSRLDQEYGLWWECAELLVELGGGSSSLAAATASNPNLTSHSSSSALSTNTNHDDPPPIPKHHSKQANHAPSMSDPGSIFQSPSSPESHNASLRATSPSNHWRASTGRHDLSARQLRLLRDMLNTPDPSTLPDSTAYTQIAGSSSPPHPYLTTKPQAWNGHNSSALTLPSEESFVGHNDDMTVEKNREKKRRLGIIDFLRNIKKAAIADGRLAPRSESSLSSHTDADGDHYNCRRSPWHQHDSRHHVHESVPRIPKSPGRPSLASIFRIGGKDKNSRISSRHDDSNPIKGTSNRKASGEGSGVGDADDEHGDGDEWEKMSQSELDLTNFGSGTGTVRGRKSNKKPSLPSMHPYPHHGATTPKKTPAASRSSLLEAVMAPSFLTSNPISKPSKHKLRTASWSQTHVPPPQPSSVNGKLPVSGTVRSAPPADVNPLSDPKLTLSPESIKPLLEYAKEVSARLADCILEVQSLLGQRTQ